MKIKSQFAAICLCILISPHYLHAGTSATTLTATVIGYNSTGGNPLTFSTSSSLVVIPTNVLAQVLNLNQTVIGQGSASSSVDINVNGLDFTFGSVTASNSLVVTGPATITLKAVAGGSYDSNPTQTCSAMCTISMNQINQSNTNYFIPNTGVVIPSDAKGPVQIVLQSSSDLITWTSCLPGTYGNTYSNRFFRVIAIAQ